MNQNSEEKNRRLAELRSVAGSAKTEADRRAIAQRVLQIGRECARLPLLGGRKPEDMLYDERGLPK